MKPLPLAALAVLLSVSAHAQAIRGAQDAKDYKERKDRIAAAADPGQALSRRGMIPALNPRLAPGPEGYTLKELVENLKHTEENISGLIDYVHPWKEGVEAPTGKDADDAYRSLSAESTAARDLIKAGDVALAKGIPRDPLDGKGLRPGPILLHVGRPVMGYVNPTPNQRLEGIAGMQCNVLGHLAALIAIKRLNPPDAKAEADTEGWLENARKSLAVAEK